MSWCHCRVKIRRMDGRKPYLSTRAWVRRYVQAARLNSIVTADGSQSVVNGGDE